MLVHNRRADIKFRLRSDQMVALQNQINVVGPLEGEVFIRVPNQTEAD